jgi:hypothetical protein
LQVTGDVKSDNMTIGMKKRKVLSVERKIKNDTTNRKRKIES